MIDNIVQKFKDIILNPTETFQKLRDEQFSTAFVYFLVIIVIYIVLSSIVSMLFVGLFSAMMPGMTARIAVETSLITGIFSIVFGFICSIIGLVIGTLILHLFVYLLGGRKGIEQTFKAGIYSCTPLALIGWIPLINIIAIIWSLVLEALAVRELHEISTARAVLAVLIPIIIIFGLFVTAIITYFIIMTTTSEVMMN